MLERIVQSERIDALCEAVAQGGAMSLGGVWGSGAAAIATALHQRTKRPVVLVVGHLEQADNALDDIELFTGESCGLFSAFEAQLATDHVNEEVSSERITLLEQLAAGHAPGVIVAPILAMLQPVPTPEALEAGSREIRVGDEIPPDQLCAWLVDAGYEQSDPVDLAGQFAMRGGIVDIAISSSRGAVRLEFFGDEIDSIRRLDLDTQRSDAPLESVTLTALSITDAMAPELADRSTVITDYLPEDAIVCLLEPTELTELADKLYDRIRDDLVDDTSPVALRAVDEVFGAFDSFTRVGMQLFSGKSADRSLRMGIRSLERLAVNTAEALDELTTLSKANDVWVYCENSAQEERFVETLDTHYPELAKRATLLRGRLSEGFYWPDQNMVVVGHHEIYGRFNRVRKIRRVRAGRPVQSMLDLSEGDYVVHVGHGIAKFEGLRHLEKDGSEDEYLRLKFAEGAALHVPTSQIHLVQKYIGSRGNRPTLSHLGGGHWARTKERVAEAVKDLAEGMLKLQAMRQNSKGFVYPRRSELQRQFADEFPYTETEDQLAAIGQIDGDMETTRPMDRLICGDVGFGKTEVAMRAALKAVEAGRQVAILVPTTVLAEQHSRTFGERFADFPVTVACLSRFRTAKETTKILKQLQLGQVDILIGTHRILSKDVRFPDLGMVIIDEEQRFGVEHKERLKHLRAMVDVLTLSATPIPRTLHMALLGLRDISSLETPPMDRRSIHTEVVPKDDTLIRTAILRELNRDGQIYVVHNRVQTIDGVANHIRSL
ncbi:MAG: DEAD/DEAH box helicase, partial [Phycisphaerales bacterium]|nr:DEAD/DEAH box helicase [Phycisphaerales bacterium]